MAHADIKNNGKFSVRLDIVGPVVATVHAVHARHIEIEQMGVAVLHRTGNERGAVILAPAAYQKARAVGHWREEIVVFREFYLICSQILSWFCYF